MRKHALRLTSIGLLLFTTINILGAQEEWVSGPPVGKSVPGSFQAFNLNGRKGRDRFHCLVCEFHLNPVALIFVREGPETDPKNILEFLKQIDEKVKKNRNTYSLCSFVVFVNPDAKSAGTEAKIDDPDKLIEECKKRIQFEDRLRTQYRDFMGPLYPDTLAAMIGETAADWVNEQVYEQHPVVMAYMADGPKGYHLSTKPGVTVVLYNKLKVQQVLAFPDGKLNEEAVQQVLKGVDVLLKGTSAKKKG